MRARRAEHDGFSESVAAILEENTFGGNKAGEGKHRRRHRREMPDVHGAAGIKMEYDGTEERYPVYISLLMTDGEWVKYQIHREQPAPKISPALEAVANMKRGYPPERS